MIINTRTSTYFASVFLPGSGYDTSGDNLPDDSTRLTYLPQEERDKLAAFTEEPQYTPFFDLHLPSERCGTWEDRFAEYDRQVLSVMKLYFDSTNVSWFAISSGSPRSVTYMHPSLQKIYYFRSSQDTMLCTQHIKRNVKMYAGPTRLKIMDET